MTSVGVVIPTVGRQYLRDAVGSALHQTGVATEVTVVVDGDSETFRGVQAELGGSRVNVVQLPGERKGGAAARNYGVELAQADYIGFLDDDDIWMSEKSITQMQNVSQGESTEENILYSCNVRTFGGGRSQRWPSSPPRGSRLTEEELFWRRTLRPRPGHIQTSSWLGARQLFRSRPFREGLKLHQDWDWLSRNCVHGPVNVRHVNRDLVMYRVGSGPSVSRAAENLPAGIEWITSAGLGARATGDALLAASLGLAVMSGDTPAAREVYKIARSHGAPGTAARAVAMIKLLRLWINETGTRS